MNNQKGIRVIAAVCALCASAALLAACGEDPDVVINDAQGNAVTEATTATTQKVYTQMTLSDLLGYMDTQMKWSTIEPHPHTDVDASHATFAVLNDNGKEAILSVTYDAATDVVSEAVLSYGDVTVNMLSDNTIEMRKILLAMKDKEE